MMKKLARAALNLTLLAVAFCLGGVTLAYIFYRIYSLQSPLPTIIPAPENTLVISSPQELNELMKQELEGKFIWNNSRKALVSVATGETREVPHFYNFYDISSNSRYMVREAGFCIGCDRFEMLDLQTGTIETLVEQKEFPGSAFFGAVTIAPDNRSMVFAVAWKNSIDLVKFDFSTKTWERLNVNTLIGGFGEADISPEDRILTRCVERLSASAVLELCLLDREGKFLGYITDENDAWIGSGRYTPDGEWIVYDSHSKLYKIREDGSERQEIAPCGPAGVYIVTNHYAVISCAVSLEPACSGYFIANLDGNELWRLGYLGSTCEEK